MKLKIIYLFFILIIGGIVFAYNTNEDMESDLDETGKMLYRRVALFGKRIEERYHMNPCSVGGGAPSGKIRLMCQSFQRYGSPLMIKEARKLIVDCAKDYLEYINEDEELRPFLEVYPFTLKNLDLIVFSFNEKGYNHYHPFLENVSINKGVIYYSTVEKNQYGYKSEESETYEEAMGILKE